ncbi:MAG: hypothetical protein ACYS30_21950, partial [Planctomycetota bacterium]
MRQKRQCEFRSGLLSRIQHACRWGLTISIGLALAGCGAPNVKEDPKITALTDRLSEIETVRLEEQSSSEPITVEDATAEVVDQIEEPNVSRSEVELTLAEVRTAALENNLDLKLELINPSVAQLTLDEERAKFESLFFGSVGYSRTEAVGTGNRSRSTSYNAGLDSPLHTGGSVSVSVPFSDYDSQDFEGVSDAAVSVSFIQSLL